MTNAFGVVTAYHEAIKDRFDPDDFIGREWLLKEIAKFRNSENEKYKVIVGEPGSGKSAFLAYLAEKWNCPRHFMRFDNISGVTGISPRSFLISVGEQLHQKYGPEIFGERGEQSTTVSVESATDKAQVIGKIIDIMYALPFLKPIDHTVQVRAGHVEGNSKVVGEQIKKVVDITQGLDEPTLLHVMIIDPLKKLQELYPDEIVMILVDALDESLQQPGVKIPEVIPSPSDPDFPKNLRFVMTSREGDHLIRFQEHVVKIDDDTKSVKNRSFKDLNEQDVKDYIRNRLNRDALAPIAHQWDDDKVKTAYIDNLSSKSERNFLYLYHFFNELNERVKNGKTDLSKIGIPSGLNGIYRDYAVMKIRTEVSSAVRFTVLGDLGDDFVEDLKNTTGVKQVDVTGSEVTLELVKDFEDTDGVTEKLFDLAGEHGIRVKNLKTPKRTDWEKNYLPILGVLAVGYEALTRTQIAEFARVEAVYVDRIISHLKQFLDVTSDETENRYRIFHLTFAEYLLDSARNQEYPLDGPTYHYQIATTHRGDKNWTEVDWEAINDGYTHRHLIQHIHAARRYGELPVLLLHFPWMLAKLDRTDVNAMMADYEFGLKPEAEISNDISYALRMVRDALRLSAHILIQDKFQLPSQLLGRMLGFQQPEIQGLMEQIKNWKSDRPWLRPITPCLKSPGDFLVRTITGHTKSVEAVVLTGDGKQLISASVDGTLKLWDVESGKLLDTFGWHTGYVQKMVLTEDGKQVILASVDNTLKVWDVEMHDVRTLTENFDDGLFTTCSALVLTRDGKRIISASSQEDTLKVWDVDGKTKKALYILGGHAGRINALALTSDDKFVVSASIDQTIKIWSLATNELFRTLEGHTGEVTALALTRDGRQIISASRETLKIWNLETGELLHTHQNSIERITMLALTRDDKWIISGSSDGIRLKIWDVETGNVLHTLSGHTEKINALASTRDGKVLISASYDHTLKVWNLDAEPHESLHPHEEHVGEVTALAMTDDGKQVISAAWDIKAWDVETGEVLRTFKGYAGRVDALALAGNGKYVLSVSLDNTIKVWSTETGEVLRTLSEHNGKLASIASSENIKRLIWASSLDRIIKVWDVENFDVLRTLDGHAGRVDALALNWNGKRAISASLEENKLIVWDVEIGRALLGRTLLAVEAGDWLIMPMALTGDGKRMILGSLSHLIKVWDIEAGNVLHTLEGHAEGITTLVLSTDSKWLISASFDKTIKVWSIETGDLLHTLEGHTAEVTGLVLTNNSNNIISVSDDKTLKIWNMWDGNCIVSIHLEGVASRYIVSADGLRVVACDKGGRLYFLRLEGVDWLCQKPT